MNAEMHRSLAAEFPSNKVQPKTGRGGKTFKYISHGLVTERLNHVDPNWSSQMVTEHIYYDDDKRPHCGAVTIALTIGSVTRVETGGPQNITGSEKFPYNFADEMKNAYSDALKRAAMRFGVALSMWEDLIESEGDEDANPNQTYAESRQYQSEPGYAPERTTSSDGEEKRVTRPGDPPSERQLKWLEDLLDARQKAGENVASQMVAVKNTRDNRGWRLTRAMASEWIDEMTKRNAIPSIPEGSIVVPTSESGGIPTDKRARLMVRNDVEKTVWTNIIKGLDKERETYRELLHIANIMTEGSDDPASEGWRYETLAQHAPLNGEIIDGIAMTASRFGASTPELEEVVAQRFAELT